MAEKLTNEEAVAALTDHIRCQFGVVWTNPVSIEVVRSDNWFHGPFTKEDLMTTDSGTVEPPMYSGRVLTEYPLGPDFLGIYLHTDDSGSTMLRIETAGPAPVRAMLGLTKEQARNLMKCLHNGIERWEGREP